MGVCKRYGCSGYPATSDNRPNRVAVMTAKKALFPVMG